jgi:endonuclease-3 related protein
MRKAAIRDLYDSLLSALGPQGWWPLVRHAGKKGFDSGGYRSAPGYVLAETDRFEICLGAILTQNTSWANVASALPGLFASGVDSSERLLETEDADLAGMIRSCGYFNQKTKKLKIMAAFLSGTGCLRSGAAPAREDLLALWGIGPETADSILLYAFNEPIFVVDAYAKRLGARLGILPPESSYSDIQKAFTDALPLDEKLFNEYHALIVGFCKRFCAARPLCSGCPLSARCPSRAASAS